MIGPYRLRPSWILSRLEAHCGFLIGEKRTRILEDMVVPGSFHVEKVIMILLSPVFVLSTSNPPNSFALILSLGVRLLYWQLLAATSLQVYTSTRQYVQTQMDTR
jgi:hypothetical protein